METSKLEIVAEFADGQTYQFNIANPRSDLESDDITALQTQMLSEQPMQIGNTINDSLAAFTRISSATVVTTIKTPVYEAELGLWSRDQNANAWKDNY